ncbi:MAG: hypothetical protein AAGA60_18000 [Cyanobacteria bacterium P01_E01_bin.42]
MNTNQFPKGWDEKRVQGVLSYYEEQTEDEAIAEDEAIFNNGETLMQIPIELVPIVQELIAKYEMSKPEG